MNGHLLSPDNVRKSELTILIPRTAGPLVNTSSEWLTNSHPQDAAASSAAGHGSHCICQSVERSK